MKYLLMFALGASMIFCGCHGMNRKSETIYDFWGASVAATSVGDAYTLMREDIISSRQKMKEKYPEAKIVSFDFDIVPDGTDVKAIYLFTFSYEK